MSGNVREVVGRTASIASDRRRGAGRCRGGFQTLPYGFGAAIGPAFAPVAGIIENICPDTLEIGIGTDDPVMEAALPDPGTRGMPDEIYPPGGECLEAAHKLDKRRRAVPKMHHAMKVVRHDGEFVKFDGRVMRPQLQPAFFDDSAEPVRPPDAIFDTAEQVSVTIGACRDEIGSRRCVIVTGQAGRLAARERPMFRSPTAAGAPIAVGEGLKPSPTKSGEFALGGVISSPAPPSAG